MRKYIFLRSVVFPVVSSNKSNMLKNYVVSDQEVTVQTLRLLTCSLLLLHPYMLLKTESCLPPHQDRKVTYLVFSSLSRLEAMLHCGSVILTTPFIRIFKKLNLGAQYEPSPNNAVPPCSIV